ncbi:hypothetical protein AMAG_17991 [Allomyces macrogynus ATCC 38327]|uniref:Uncharacterized protein n=1 Tax=Allomyces macrogynus (strain ATCC 38327) TaxID=578462 RepID=A0A0L0S3L9_ALLM3|nr:hypothetical protein AMAG_17991 [Allomyces macrogynus ATCC 38327]|eukprot:KNE56996.1 hypothetical protein AMAG_17991 [Allomyces macrogynus ATCC 38327]
MSNRERKPSHRGSRTSTGNGSSSSSSSSTTTNAATSTGGPASSTGKTASPLPAPTSFITLNSSNVSGTATNPEPFPVVVDWIGRSLVQFEDVFVLAVEPWIPAAISVLDIARSRGIAEVNNVDTLTVVDDRSGDPVACIQVNLGRGERVRQKLALGPVRTPTARSDAPSATDSPVGAGPSRAIPSSSGPASSSSSASGARAVFVPNWNVTKSAS